MIKTLMASLLAFAFLAAALPVTTALAAEDAPSTPAPTGDQDSSSSSSSSAPPGIGSGGKRCGSGHEPSV